MKKLTDVFTILDKISAIALRVVICLLLFMSYEQVYTLIEMVS